MEAYAAMSEWLSDAPRPLVLGADLNTWQDPVDLVAADPTRPFHEERESVGPHPKHELVDAYRTVVEGDGTIDQMRASASTGPLAVSYVLEDGAEHRIDRIFASPDLMPIAGGYDFQTAPQGGERPRAALRLRRWRSESTGHLHVQHERM